MVTKKKMMTKFAYSVASRWKNKATIANENSKKRKLATDEPVDETAVFQFSKEEIDEYHNDIIAGMWEYAMNNTAPCSEIIAIPQKNITDADIVKMDTPLEKNIGQEIVEYNPLPADIFYEFPLQELQMTSVANFSDFVTKMAPRSVMDIACDEEHRYTDKEKQKQDSRQHRPLGSKTLINLLPEEMRACPCNCSTRDASSEIDIQTGIANLLRAGYIRIDEPLILVLPDIGQMHPERSSLVSLGKLVVDDRSGTNLYQFHDIGEGTTYCCPTMWFFYVFMRLAADGLVSSFESDAMRIRSQMSARNHCTTYIYSAELGVTLSILMRLYRHEIGMQQKTAKGKVRVEVKTEDTSTKFMTRDEIKLFFEGKRVEEWPQDRIWKTAMKIRIDEQEKLIIGLTEIIKQTKK